MNELQGHLANITCLCFIPSDPTSLVTVSDDRTFKVSHFILCNDISSLDMEYY